MRLSRAMAPLIRRGIIRGNRWSGDLLVLRTRGRKSGAWREASLDYAAAPGGDGVLVAAGWGDATQWYRNLLADPRVEVVVRGRRHAGTASVVTEPAEWIRDLRAVLLGSGMAGRSGGVDPRRDPDERLAQAYAGTPVIHVAFDDGASGRG
jgi:deazaflavin-dependent oxidoreductase (nitroreductase family)